MSAAYEPVIGLEVHAQLPTRTKIFCGCLTQFGAPPNHHTCPVCLGLPGALPVLNEAAVEMAVRAGLALECEICRTSVWSRKNYFYPDLPKGYQITQFDLPICEGGRLRVPLGDAEREVRIRRIHMEEDAGKSTHDAAPGVSLVDLNRAGVPLLEIVSEPDLRAADEAAEYLRSLRDILVSIGVNDGNLEEGSFRCDANVSVRPRGDSKLGTRVELKNINSFRFVQKAIELEVARQSDELDAGRDIVQQTRLFDSQRGETRPMRSKEDAHDYRYFPEPDLPPLVVSDALVERVRSSLPELPRARVARFQAEYGLPAYDAGILGSDPELAALFDAGARLYPERKRLSNWFLGELSRLRGEAGLSWRAVPVSPERLVGLLQQVDSGVINAGTGKAVLEEMFKQGRTAEEVIEARGLTQVFDESALLAAIDEVLRARPDEVSSYRAGKKQVFGFLMGQVMRALKGRGNPKRVSEILAAKLS